MKQSTLKSMSDFYLEIDAIHGNVLYYDRPTINSSDGNTLAIYNGVIYNSDEFGEVLNKSPYEIANQLEGLYSLVIIRDSKVFLITDRTNSHKVFYTKSSDKFIVSSDIERLIPRNYRLDVGGVMNFAINNCLINEKTIFEGIYYIPSATVSSVEDNRFTFQNYYHFAFYDKARDSSDIGEQLSASLTYGIDNILEALDNPVLAMSAGWDSRAIMFYLSKLYKGELHSFSYKDSLYDKFTDTDADLSQQIASSKGIPHDIVNLYNGNFVELLRKNAEIGKCVSAFCYELDAFDNLSKKGFTDIIFGDHIFGYGKKDITIRSKEDVLQQIAVYKSSSARFLRRLFKNKKQYEYDMKCLDTEVDRMYDLSGEIDSFTDKKDFLYFQQQVLNLITPLRQMIGGMIGTVHDPFLNNKAIDACQYISTNGRIDKTLYKSVLMKQFPNLFDVPYAKHSGRGVDWMKEILKSREEILDRINYYPDQLAAVIPKDVVVKLISSIPDTILKHKLHIVKNYYVAGMGFLRRRYNIVEVIANKLVGPHRGIVDPIVVLVNILYIREYLEKIDLG